MNHNCQSSLGSGLRDGQRKACPVCKKVHEFVMCDGKLGSYWVEQVTVPKNSLNRSRERKRLAREAQQVWCKNTGRPTGGEWNPSYRKRRRA